MAQLREGFRRQLRTALAWATGLITAALISVAVGAAGAIVDVPQFIALDPPVTREIDGNYSEIDAAVTSFGIATGFFAVVVGVWAGRATHSGSISAGFTHQGRLTYLAWLMTAAILIPTSALLDLAFLHRHGWAAHYVRIALELGIAAGVVWACRQWWKNRIADLGGRR